MDNKTPMTLTEELKNAVAILKKVYLVAVIPNSDGQDHINVQHYLNLLENHVNSLESTTPENPPEQPAPEASQAPVASPAPDEQSTGYADSTSPAQLPEQPAETPAPTPPENPAPTV